MKVNKCSEWCKNRLISNRMQGSAHATFLLLETSSKNFPKLQGPAGFYIFMRQPWAKAEFTGEGDTAAHGDVPGLHVCPSRAAVLAPRGSQGLLRKVVLGRTLLKVIFFFKWCKGQLCFRIGNLMRLWSLGWKYTSQLFTLWARRSFSPSGPYMSFCQQSTERCFNLVFSSHCWQRSLRSFQEKF